MTQNENLSETLRQKRHDLPARASRNDDEMTEEHRLARREVFERLHQERQEARQNARRRLLGLRAQAEPNPPSMIRLSPIATPAPAAAAPPAEPPAEPVTPRLDHLQSQFTALEDRLTGHDGQLSEIGGQVTTIDGRVETLDSYVPKIDSNFVKLDSQISTIEGQVMNLDRQLIKADRQLTGLDGRVGNLDGDVSRLGGQVTSLGEQFAALDNELTASFATYDQRLGQLEQDLAQPVDHPVVDDEAGPRVAEIESEVKVLRDTIGELASQINPFDEQFDHLRVELRRLDESLDSISGDMTRTGERSASLDADFNRLGSLVEVVAGELKRLQDRADSTAQERLAAEQETTRSVGGLDNRLTTVEAALLHVTQQVEGSARSAAPDANLQQRFDELEEEFRQLQRVVEQMQVERAAERADRLILASRGSHSDGEPGEPTSSEGALSGLTKLISGLKSGNKREKPDAVSHD